MRRIVTAITAASLALSLTALAVPTPAAAASGFDSSYAGESAFLTLAPGASGTFTVFFANTGTTTWAKGTSTQVDLAACLDDKVTCNQQDAGEASFNPSTGGWLSATRYATTTQASVAPGQIGTFTYNVTVPSTATGLHHFNGAVVVSSSGADVHNEGYFQDLQVSGTPTTSGLSIVPAFGTNVDNFVPATTTVTVSGFPAGKASVTTLFSSNVSQSSTTGAFSFSDTNSDKRADGVCAGSGSVSIISVNGASQATGTSCVFQFTVPASGAINIQLQSSTNNGRIRVVVWQDLNLNGQIDLSAAGLADGTKGPYDATTDGVLIASGIEFFFPPLGTFGTTIASSACQAVIRFDSKNNVFSTSTTAFTFDSNDIFRISGAMTDLATFKSALVADSSGAGSTVSLTFNPDPAGVSEFNICNTAGAAAPTAVTATVGNFDAGTTANDVQISFHTPATNSLTTSYQIQRATVASTVTSCADTAQVAASSFSTVGTVTADADTDASFTDFNVATGTYCYRVRVVNPITGAESTMAQTSPAGPVTVPAAVSTDAPTATETILTNSAGLASTLDSGDKFTVRFSRAINLSATALLRFKDADCGTATGAGTTGDGDTNGAALGTPAPSGTCSGNATQTVGDVICGTNATCTLTGSSKILTVTLTADPTIISAGTVAGLQFPVKISDARGITDQLTGNAFNITGSTDRTMGPAIGQ